MISKNILVPFFFFIFCLIVRWQSFSFPLDRDEGAYAYIASHLFENSFVPYRDAWDHKPPGIYLIYWMGFQIFGESDLTIRILAFLNAFLSSLIFFHITKILVPNFKKQIIFSLIFIFFSSTLVLEGLHSNTEPFMLTFLLLGILLLFQSFKKLTIWILLLAGLSYGFSLLIKPVAIFPILGIFIWLFFYQQKYFYRYLTFISIGISLPLVATVLIFFQANSLDELFQSVIIFNRSYSSEGFQNIHTLAELFKWTFSIPLPVYFLLVIPLTLLIFQNNLRKDKFFMFGLFYLVFSLIGAKFLSKNVGHYYLPVTHAVPLVLLASPLGKIGKYSLFALVAIFFYFWSYTLFLSPKSALQQIYGPSTILTYRARELGLFLNQYPSYSVLSLIDEPQIYFYADKKSPHRYINSYLKTSDHKEKNLEALKNFPTYVITYNNWLTDDLAKIIISDYKLERHPISLSGPLGPFVYRLKN